ncbi:MAG: cation:proton antiporter [Rhodospirillales bacterium]|nr:MAG: cation:proton antiporter [Rhodospirillales bacterium]
MEDTLQLTGMAFVIVAATLCGMAMTRLNQPAIVGYIVAGVLLGPSGLGLVTDRAQVGALAELGVLMLLFFIGMELSLRSFRFTWRIGLYSTLIQIAVSIGAMLVVQHFMGWPLGYAVFFGFVVALSSTAVAVKMLDDVGELHTRIGRTAISVLIAQDLAVAPMLLIVGGLSGGALQITVALKVAASIGLLMAVTMFFSRRRRINLLPIKLVVGNVDLLPLAAIGWCFGFAALGGITGLTPAYGAFFAGLLVGNSAQRHAVAEVAQPVQSILLMVFFLSIGLLIDLAYLWANLWLVLALWVFVAVFKTGLNVAILQVMGEPPQRAFMTSLSLAQVGEFSFVLGAAALDHGLIASDIHRLVVAVTVVSLVTSPLWMHSARRLHDRAARSAPTPMALLKVVYVREWRLTLRLTSGVAQWFDGLIIRVKAHYWRRRHERELQARAETLPPPANDPLPEAEPPDEAPGSGEDRTQRGAGDA